MKLALTALLILLASTPAAEGPFRSLEFDAALATAKEEGKVVMVDFFTTWCGPCKKLDQTTWKDEAVVAWLDEQTVALKLDAEKEVELAKRYRIRAYPTLLFVRPDGTELDRLVGYRAPAEFLEQAVDALAGKGAVERAQEALVGKKNDPMLRGSLADAFAQAGRYEEALAEYLWCYDHGLDHNASYAGVRSSFLLGDIVSLGREYPPAREALRERRDRARGAVLAGRTERRVLRDLMSLNRDLGEKANTLALYDELADLKDREWTRTQLAESVADLLVKERRYTDVLRHVGDLGDWFEGQLRRAQMMTEGEEEGPMAIGPFLRGQLLLESGRYYEALVGAGTRPEFAQPSADEFEARILAFDGTGATYARLIKHAVRAEDFDRARSLAARAEASLTDAKDLKRVRRAARRIPELQESPED